MNSHDPHNNKDYDETDKKIILSKFTEQYLSSLNVYLDDDKFFEKTLSLPKLNTGIASRVEKSVKIKKTVKSKKKGMPAISIFFSS